MARPLSVPQRHVPLCEVAGLPADPADPRTHSMLGAHAADPASTQCPYRGDSGAGEESRCLKVSSTNPLPVCSLFENGDPERPVAISCPNRFLQNGTVFNQIEADLLPKKQAGDTTVWISEVAIPAQGSLRGILGQCDYVAVRADAHGNVRGFVSVEIQSVYAGGSTRKAFSMLGDSRESQATIDWSQLGASYPRPDFLSSWKRIKYQLLEKGTGLTQTVVGHDGVPVPIKQALVVDSWFLSQVRAKAGHDLTSVDPEVSDFAIYACALPVTENGLRVLTINEVVRTSFSQIQALASVCAPADLQRMISALARHVTS
jgi:hypothetical protein